MVVGVVVVVVVVVGGIIDGGVISGGVVFVAVTGVCGCGGGLLVIFFSNVPLSTKTRLLFSMVFAGDNTAGC